MTDFENRLRKRQKHLAKWARRTGVTCYRLYERDMPEWPLIIDWYDGSVVMWLVDTKDKYPGEKGLKRLEKARDIISTIFDVARDNIFLKRRQRHGQNEQYTRLEQQNHQQTVSEYGLKFDVNLSDYLDTGLFLDHRQTRAMVRDMSKGKRVLNLFAYTGSFSVYALAGNAQHVTTVDISKTYIAWAKRNAQLNGLLDEARTTYEEQDCIAWLEQYQDTFDIIICDPPTISRSKKMSQKDFIVERDHVAMLNQCGRLLSPGGTIFFSNNAWRFKLDEKELSKTFEVKDISKQTVPDDFRNREIHRCWTLKKT